MYVKYSLKLKLNCGILYYHAVCSSKVLPRLQKKKPVDFANELKIGDV